MIDGYLYVCEGGPDFREGTLKCLDVETGEVIWEEDFGRTVSLTAADGKLILLVENGTLLVAEATPSSYRELSRCELPGIKPGSGGFRQYWTHPVLCNGRIYCRNSFGNLVCIDVRN
jgi:outer membrane protein assembly factor BamB